MKIKIPILKIWSIFFQPKLILTALLLSFSMISISTELALFSRTENVFMKKDTTKNDHFKLIGLPLLFYTPETKFAFGAALLSTFSFKKDSINKWPSSLQIGAAFTQLKQTLIYIPYQIWFKNSTYNLYGELGYYKYNFFFWGIGNQQPFALREVYDVKYPRVKINFLRKLAPGTYVGLKYNFEPFKISNIDSTGLLAPGTIPGSYGGRISSIGAVFKYDSRDNLFNPTKGYFVELSFQFDSRFTASTFNYTFLILDACTYLTNKFNHTLALNFYTMIGQGDMPFNHMANMGGSKKMRGFYEGRYRDKNQILLQAEYRAPLFWRIGVVGFIGVGDVSDKVANYNIKQFKIAGGGGLRIMLDKKQKINLRIDCGFAQSQTNFYVTLTEAF